MATYDIVKHLRGLERDLPILDDGRIGILEDSGNKRLVFGTVDGNALMPNQSDLNTVTTTANNAVTIANNANNNANQAISNSNTAITTSNATQAQLANIITSNGSGKDTELVDERTDADGTVWSSAGEHVRNLDKDYQILKNIQTYTSTSNGLSSIPISTAITSLVDITKINMNVWYMGVKLMASDNYTINTTNKTIDLNGWTIDNGEKIEYRVYK